MGPGASGGGRALSGAEQAIVALDARRERTLEELIEFSRIPGVSAPGFEPAQVVRSAEHVAGLLEDVGLERVEVLQVEGSHPYVLGEWLDAPDDAPTVLIYAHHDVQPPGRAERWESPAFEPTLRADGRLYGRGVVDDKAGLMLHLAALRGWLDAAGGLPVRVKLLVEGEEEIGSPNLTGFLREHRERLAADVIVLSDTANLATGVPALTTSLRGMVSVAVTVRALERPLHSGLWGGPVLDAATALSRVLARLVDDDGRIALDGIEDDVPELTDAERARLAALPFDADDFRREAGLPAGVRVAGDASRSVYERLWLRPSVAVIALESAPLAGASNQLIDEARALVGVRVAPGQDPVRVRGLVQRALEADPPWGVQVQVRPGAAVPGWRTVPEGPAFDAARRALAAGYGRPSVEIGCGGTIPFVGPFAEVLGGAPALLLGLEDPICNAHGENESLHLGDFDKSCRAAAWLLDELRSVPRLGR
ncbi:MAG: M20/M25/M40 family metallo-hydrolase [Deltaproteobacteria bacterium]|nr:M20/M25/M40 family metallo-hydrolase [Deltaproteobacteria bacterium]MBW2415446.1 M20/M25/M40 family metallo-hydrolase [Deltaproteobacteria bacterium]